MSDYSRVFTFSDKDALSTGNPAKVIKGSDVDQELDAALTAINSKTDEPTSIADGQVLAFDSGAPVAVGGLTFVESQTASSSAALEFDLDAGFDHRFHFHGPYPATSGDSLIWHMFESAVWIESTDSYQNADLALVAGFSPTGTNELADDGFVHPGPVDNIATRGVHGSMDLFAPDASIRTEASSNTRASSATAYDFRLCGSTRAAAAVATKIRFLFLNRTSGVKSNMTAGTIVHYRIRRTS